MQPFVFELRQVPSWFHRRSHHVQQVWWNNNQHPPAVGDTQRALEPTPSGQTLLVFSEEVKALARAAAEKTALVCEDGT